MTPDEILTLLQTAAAADERVVATPERAVAWQPLLEHLTLEQAVEALYGHLRASNAVVRPSDLLYLAGAQQPPQGLGGGILAVLDRVGELPIGQELEARRWLAGGATPDEVIIRITTDTKAVEA
jgi:hypothetical protein